MEGIYLGVFIFSDGEGREEGKERDDCRKPKRPNQIPKPNMPPQHFPSG